ncbi:MAG: 2-keto-4-pentenoate hydratase [Pseudomonadota bacterium]
MTTSSKLQDHDAEIARRFVDARRSGRCLAAYPGEAPRDLAHAYRVQDRAIALWGDAVAGWKIGLVQPQHRAAFGAERIAGPIFADTVQINAQGGPFEFSVFDGGFAAVEAELMFRIGADAPTDKRTWTPDEIAPFIEAVHIGVECAGSPFAEINEHGPGVTASDFGNNAGLLIGPEVRDWRALDMNLVTAQVRIDDDEVGRANAANIPGGPMAALVFIFEHAALRGKPLQRGQWISTGAITGVHEIAAGQYAEADFGALGSISCSAVAFSPERAL